MDEIAKRREARRLKILNNSAARLSKITGVEEKPTKIQNCLTTNHVDDYIPTSPIVPVEATPVVHPQIEEKEPPRKHKGVVLCGLAMFINLLLTLLEKFNVDHSETHVNKIFLPLLLFELTELFTPQKPSQSNNNLLYTLLLTNLQKNNVGHVLKYLNFTSEMVQDVMVYFFVFACCELCKSVLFTR